MAKDFIKKVAIGVAITLASAAALSGVSLLSDTLRGTDEEPLIVCGHAGEVTIPAVLPTCTEGGWTAGSRCELCGGIIEEPKYVPPLGHIGVEIPAVAAGCSSTGLSVGEKCRVCDEILVKQEIVSPLGHDSVDCSMCDLTELEIYATSSTSAYTVYKSDGETPFNKNLVYRLEIPVGDFDSFGFLLYSETANGYSWLEDGYYVLYFDGTEKTDSVAITSDGVDSKSLVVPEKFITKYVISDDGKYLFFKVNYDSGYCEELDLSFKFVPGGTMFNMLSQPSVVELEVCVFNS